MAYKHNDALYTHRQRAFRFRKAVIVIFVFLALIIMTVAVDWIFSQFQSSDSVVSRIDTTSVQSANVSVYRTKFYQFQAPQEWALSTDSTDTKFVYFKSTGSLITQKLVVYVNRPVIDREADFKITRVLPVTVSELGNLMPESAVSPHCKQGSPEGFRSDPSRISYEGVSFVCNHDSEEYNILLGQKGGNENVPMKLKDGTTVTFTIVYSDLTAYPGTGDVFKIATSFTAL